MELFDLLAPTWRRVALVLILVASVAVGVVLSRDLEPRFRSTVQVELVADGGGVGSRDLLVATYRELATSREVTAAVADEVGVSDRRVRSGLSTVRTGQLPVVRVRWEGPRRAGSEVERIPELVAVAALEELYADELDAARTRVELAEATLAAQDEVIAGLEADGFTALQREEYGRLTTRANNLVVRITDTRADLEVARAALAGAATTGIDPVAAAAEVAGLETRLGVYESDLQLIDAVRAEWAPLAAELDRVEEDRSRSVVLVAEADKALAQLESELASTVDGVEAVATGTRVPDREDRIRVLAGSVAAGLALAFVVFLLAEFVPWDRLTRADDAAADDVVGPHTAAGGP